jgi:hypothetical protein
MFVPIPILIAAGVLILVLIAMIARAGRRRDRISRLGPQREDAAVEMARWDGRGW